jgi:hypothetical protein
MHPTLIEKIHEIINNKEYYMKKLMMIAASVFALSSIAIAKDKPAMCTGNKDVPACCKKMAKGKADVEAKCVADAGAPAAAAPAAPAAGHEAPAAPATPEHK